MAASPWTEIEVDEFILSSGSATGVRTAMPIYTDRQVRQPKTFAFPPPTLSRPSPRRPSFTTMLVLYETAMGYCLFKMSKSATPEDVDLWKEFESPEKANKL